MRDMAQGSQGEEWRDQILNSLTHLFEGKRKSCLYGPEHAQLTEKIALGILAIWECGAQDEAAVSVLRCAALLHDAGYARRTVHWGQDCFEHVQAGTELALEILAHNSLIQAHPERLHQVLYLIQHHDDSTYLFPTATRNGGPFLAQPHRALRDLAIALAILREADGRVASNQMIMSPKASFYQKITSPRGTASFP